MSVRWGTRRDFPKGNATFGVTHINRAIKSGEITLAKEKHMDGVDGSDPRYDLEATLVHELLHFHFDGVVLDKDMDGEGALTRMGVATEQAIESIAQGLVELKRQRAGAAQ